MINQLWVEKYKPKQLTDFIGNRNTATTIYKWLNYFYQSKGISSFFVTGPPGVGKTSSIHVIAKLLQYDLIEVNASDKRTVSSICTEIGICYSIYKKKIIISINNTLLKKKKRLILFDECDGLTKNALPLIIALIKENKCPVILISNSNFYNTFKGSYKTKGYNELKKIITTSVYQRLHPNDAHKLIKRIAEQERNDTNGGNFNDIPLYQFHQIYDACNKDIRSTINEFQYILGTKSPNTFKHSDLGRMENYLPEFTEFRRTMITGTPNYISISNYQRFIGCVHDNYKNFSLNRLKCCANVANCLSNGDVTLKTLQCSQDYSMFPVVSHLSLIMPSYLFRQEARSPEKQFPWRGKFPTRFYPSSLRKFMYGADPTEISMEMLILSDSCKREIIGQSVFLDRIKFGGNGGDRTPAFEGLLKFIKKYFKDFCTGFKFKLKPTKHIYKYFTKGTVVKKRTKTGSRKRKRSNPPSTAKTLKKKKKKRKKTVKRKPKKTKPPVKRKNTLFNYFGKK